VKSITNAAARFSINSIAVAIDFIFGIRAVHVLNTLI
jgi:hypothetical protein